MERLDSFSKILIATAQVNYMAAAINGVNEQIKFLKDNPFHQEGIKQRDAILAQTEDKLSDIMEDLGNYMNNNDCLTKIDERVTTVAFNIIQRGMDEVETIYPDDVIA